MRFSILSATTIGLTTALVQTAYAQQAPQQSADQSADNVQTVIVTGTRRTGVTAEKSSSPIQVVGGTKLAATGLPNLSQELNLLVPSFSSPTYGQDLSNLTTSAVLRGLTPNDVLVLVNGKRRHPSADIVARYGPSQGSNSVDLDLIPASAIDHIEVLTDGAAAQYGSDAIAGVINIILKNSDHGGVLSGTAGEYYGDPLPEVHEAGDGFQTDGSGNVGIGLGDNGFLNLSAEYKHHLENNITGPDLRGAKGGVLPDPYQGRFAGDPEGSLETLSYNAGVNYDDINFYSFGTYSHSHGISYGTARTTTAAAGLSLNGVALPNIYPLGFVPAATLTQDDYSFTAGAKSQFLGWNWDLSSTYGENNEAFNNVDTINLSLYAATGGSPTEFHIGDLNDSEWTNNLDISHPYEIGLAAPLNVAIGGEYRYETFEINPGDPASRYGVGAAANPGFALSDAHNVYRDSVGTYIDFSTKITPEWSVDTTGRFEHYSDSGDDKVGKFSTRYDFNPQLGVRATVSNGFRAPSLEQSYYSSTPVTPTSFTAQLPVNSAAAALLGAQPLKPEVSDNYSAGLVAEPLPHLKMTLDTYEIDIRNRIIDTGNISGPLALEAILLNGNQVPAGARPSAQYFANAIATHTRGIEFSTSYPQNYGDFGEVNYSISANYNNTAAKVSAANALRFNITPSALSYVTSASPHIKVILNAFYTIQDWDVNLRGTYYGESKTIDPNLGTGLYYKDEVGAAFIPDLEIGYTLDRWHFAVGADNLLNQFPNKVNPAFTAPTNGEIYNFFSPYGYQGGYYYGRVSYTF